MAKLSAHAHKILNDEARIAQRNLWFGRMSNIFDGKPDDYNQKYLYTLHGSIARPADENLMYTDPEKWTIECLEMLADIPECTENRFAPICVDQHYLYGVHFIDRIFGADVFFKDGQWNARYLTTPIGELQMPDIEKDETWNLAKRAALAFVDADVKLPLFGMPTLSSALNILINLYGGEALIAMLEDEEAAMHDLTVINDLIRSLHRWFRANIPHDQLQAVVSWDRTQPPGYGQLCGCSCHLLSGELYGKMVAPLDDALLSEHPHGGMIHLCGMHAQHIPFFREMKHLRALQLNDRATHDLKLFLNGLRDDQIIYISPCEGMPLEKIMEISGGKRVILVADGNAPELK